MPFFPPFSIMLLSLSPTVERLWCFPPRGSVVALTALCVGPSAAWTEAVPAECMASDFLLCEMSSAGLYWKGPITRSGFVDVVRRLWRNRRRGSWATSSNLLPPRSTIPSAPGHRGAPPGEDHALGPLEGPSDDGEELEYAITTGTVQHLIKQLFLEWKGQDEDAPSAVSIDSENDNELSVGTRDEDASEPQEVQLRVEPAENEKTIPEGPEFVGMARSRWNHH